MTGIYLLLGSNLGNREQNLRLAREQIFIQLGPLQRASSVYHTEAWQMSDAPTFLNQVLLIDSSAPPLIALDKILSIEKSLGRTREQGYQNRTIDIDILYYGELIIDLPQLIVPHPKISERRFVLEPLTEIAPEFVHPVLQKTSKYLLDQCTDQLSVSRW